MSLAAGLEAKRQGLTEEELEAEMEKIKEQLYSDVMGWESEDLERIRKRNWSDF